MSKKQPSLTAAHTIKNHRLAGWLSAIFCASVVFSGLAQAAQEKDDDARWFEVEIIIFAHNDPQALDAEQWPDIEGIELPLKNLVELRLPADTDAESAQDTTTETAAEGTTEKTIAPAAPIAFQLLDKSEWQLTKTAKRLKRSSRFEPLLHIAWRQPTYELAQAQPVLIYNGMDEPIEIEESAGEPGTEKTKTPADGGFSENPAAVYATEADTRMGPPNPRLIGTIKLSVARYLHLAADLLYRIPVTQQYAKQVPDFDLWYDRPYPTLYEPQGPAYRLEEWQAMRGFRMLESRRMRSKVVHYLDHPFFGMIVLITPVELPKAEEDSEAPTQ